MIALLFATMIASQSLPTASWPASADRQQTAIETITGKPALPIGRNAPLPTTRTASVPQDEIAARITHAHGFDRIQTPSGPEQPLNPLQNHLILAIARW
ncbi:hypothetical protein J2792_002853 [Novosphingobium capsulatum]|uniref:Uncharacterized protein n=1 Tax=Novosphingobium capsulatum TaxID=13688 RepID=A0ABU1MNQ0_9SPHN|nr:hypothetical protein [Novosphingobium capsulatum]MDR6511970.1 hypothetical protein [Novosphingobium capsulatum]